MSDALCPLCRLSPPAPGRGYCPSCLVSTGRVLALPAELPPILMRGPDGPYLRTFAPMVAFSDRARRRLQTVPLRGYYCQCGNDPCQSCREAERWIWMRGDGPVVVWDDTRCAICGFSIDPGTVYCAACFAEEEARGAFDPNL